MDIRQLRYFVAIAEEGSLSKAAERLHVAQPALSQHIRNMESDLRVKILFRSSRGVQLTEAGERLLAEARILLLRFDGIEDVVSNGHADPRGEVRFGIPGTVSQVFSARLIQETAHRYPKIKLRVAEAMSGFILEWLREGKVDIAVLYRESDARGLHLREVMSEQLLLLGSPDAIVDSGIPPGEPVSYCVAARMPLVIPSPGHGLRELLDEVASVQLKTVLNVKAEVDSYAPIKALVHKGFGFSILPSMAVREECRSGRLRTWPICQPDLVRKIFVASPANAPRSTASLVVEELCLKLLAQLVNEGLWDATLA